VILLILTVCALSFAACIVIGGGVVCAALIVAAYRWSGGK